MSKKILDAWAKEFRKDGDLELCEDADNWIDFLMEKSKDYGVSFAIRDCHGWQHVSPKKPFQLELPTPDAEEFSSYVIAFFGSEAAARKFAAKKGLMVLEGLAE